jgi:hypothetical protein
MSKQLISLMLDSGAFTCFTQKKQIDIAEYTKFCLDNSQRINHIINLDVIAPKDPEIAASSGWDNLLYMRDKGIDAIPVYHARENIDWFERMLTLCSYVGISGTSLVSPSEQLHFYDLAFNYGTDSEGRPVAKYHLFGDSSPYALLNMPAFSADSATYMLMGGRAGSVKLNGKSYRLRSKTVSDANYISDDSTGLQKESWEEECRFLGLNPEVVMKVVASGSELAMIRSFLVASDLLKLQERSVDCTTFKQPSKLITNKHQLTGGKERVGPIKLYFVLSPSAYVFNFPIIQVLNIKNVLVSYYYVIHDAANFWNDKLIPFLEDPLRFCQTDEKTRKFYDKLQECLLKEEVTV